MAEFSADISTSKIKNHQKTGGSRWQEDILFCREIVVDLIKNSVL